MILAAILLLFLCGPLVAPSASFRIQESSPQSSAADKTTSHSEAQGQSAAPAQDQSTAPSENPPTSAKPLTAPQTASKANSSASAKHPHHKKKPPLPNCDNSTGADGASTGSTSSNGGNANAANATGSAAPTNCPPTKVIVHQGGITEQNVQLTGAEGSKQAANQRDTSSMLEATDENLKKIAGRQLTKSQQDMEKQIRQFMAQSKIAVKEGNLERARTLAWKAQLLSQELLNPQQ